MLRQRNVMTRESERGCATFPGIPRAVLSLFPGWRRTLGSMSAARHFRVMGSDAHVIVTGGSGGDLVSRAVDRLDDLEARWSRFRPDSEISRLNTAAGAPCRVSESTRTLVALAIEAWRVTGGLVDAGVLAAMTDAGYDRSFDELERAAAPVSRRRARWTPPPALTDIEIDGDVVRLPAGLTIDPGGIGKGFAADLVTEELMGAGADGVLVNLGGDLRVRGIGPDGTGWTVDLDHERLDGPLARIGLADGAVATSTTLRRRWIGPDGPAHHLIDPRTGRPSTSDIDHAVAIAGHGWMAEIMAKAVLLRGRPHQFDIVGGTGAEALSVGVDGSIAATPGFAAHLGDAAVPTSLSECSPLEVAS